MVSALAVASSIVVVAAEGGETPNILAVPIDELIIGIIAFLVVFFVLGKFALQGVKRVLEERADAIEGGIARAATAEAQANELLEQYKAQLANAREEAAAIRTQAQSERAAIVEEARSEARQAALQVTTAAEAQLSADRAQATAQLTRQVGELAVTLASKVVGESLSDDARISATVNAFLDDLEREASR